jgi:hypothetical protein
MALRIWRWLRQTNSRPGGAKRHPTAGTPVFRPRLDALEERMLPTPWAGGIAGAAAVSSPSPPAATLGGSQQVEVAVQEDAGSSVIDLSTVLANWQGMQQGRGLRLSIVDNTNRTLVNARLVESELTLTYTRGQQGSATVTVGATNAAGVSVQVKFAIVVQGGASSQVVKAPSAPLQLPPQPLDGLGGPSVVD